MNKLGGFLNIFRPSLLGGCFRLLRLLEPNPTLRCADHRGHTSVSPDVVDILQRLVLEGNPHVSSIRSTEKVKDMHPGRCRRAPFGCGEGAEMGAMKNRERGEFRREDLVIMR